MKGAATNTDGNDGDNEVKLRAAKTASRGGCEQQSWQSSEQDAAVQRNHRVEGFLCVSLRSQSKITCAPANDCCVVKLTTITVQRKSQTDVLLTHRWGFNRLFRPLHYATS